jgi:hypothetical protein
MLTNWAPIQTFATQHEDVRMDTGPKTGVVDRGFLCDSIEFNP